jgi:EAL and modified HD-GYP domain-containing signal transduction protein
VQAIEGNSVYDIKEAADALMISFCDINAALIKAMASAAQLD